jgi:15-cis-phytoene synthase
VTNINLFNKLSENCSRNTTLYYSTSFFSAINHLHKDLRQPVYNIYGFVRLADEIVDTFHAFDKKQLLQEFKQDTFTAIERGISLNPVLNSFQQTVNKYNIEHELIVAFFNSMEMDLQKIEYSKAQYNEYIYGSAEVVGLMCLYVFCDGNKEAYNKLKSAARSLGAAFQKINFLRDIKADYEGLSRMYFPDCDFKNFSCADKLAIEKDIEQDFSGAYSGIIQLPVKARFGVFVAYKYYYSLFKKIKKLQPQKVLHQRIRIPDYAKTLILAKAGLRNQLNIF